MIAPIINSKGKLSCSLLECLSNWKDFYENLYASDRPTVLFSPSVYNAELDDPFSYSELVLAVASLCEHTCCGADYISANDMTVLIHVDPDDPSYLVDNIFIRECILSMINSLWESERVPPTLKQSILRPIIK